MTVEYDQWRGKVEDIRAAFWALKKETEVHTGDHNKCNENVRSRS